MLSIYNYMASGVLLSGIVALLFRAAGRMARAQVFIAAPLRLADHPRAARLRLRDELRRATVVTTTLQAMFWGFAC